MGKTRLLVQSMKNLEGEFAEAGAGESCLQGLVPSADGLAPPWGGGGGHCQHTSGPETVGRVNPRARTSRRVASGLSVRRAGESHVGSARLPGVGADAKRGVRVTKNPQLPLGKLRQAHPGRHRSPLQSSPAQGLQAALSTPPCPSDRFVPQSNGSAATDTHFKGQKGAD